MLLNDASRAAPQPDRLAGRDMLCFSHDWSGDPLSKTHLMRLLARENRVLWVNSIGYRAPTVSRRDAGRALRKLMDAAAPLSEPIPNLFVLNPLIIPAHGKASVRAFNSWFLRLQVRRAMQRLGMQRVINWVFNPAAALIAGSLNEDFLIYYCVDEYAAFSGVASEHLRSLERELLERADFVVASSERLWRSKWAVRPDAVLVRHGVDWTHFRSALAPRTQVPSDLAGLPRPVLGYFGLLSHDWVDVELIAHVARALPNTTLVLIGRQTMDLSALRSLANVHLLGHRPYESLPSYCKGFDAAMIPFPISEVTLNANPLKAREYLAAGLPVISTDIPEAAALKHVRIAKNRDDFVEQVRGALAQPGPSALISDAVREESWESRLVDVCSHLKLTASRRAGQRLAA